MTLCKLNDRYLDHTLSAEESEAYERHLTRCPECREKTFEWREFERNLATLAVPRPQAPVTVQEAEALMTQASEPSFELQRPLVIVTAPLAVAVCVLAVALWVGDYFVSPDEATDPVSDVVIVSPKASETIHRGRPAAPLKAPEHEALIATIDADRLGLSPGGALKVLQAQKNRVRIKLINGTVACSVSPRRSSGRFVVEAGDYTVRVMGTRFAVTTTPTHPFNVLVEKGTVEVRNTSGVAWMLRKGDVLTVDEHGQLAPRRAADEEIAILDDLLIPGSSVESIRRSNAPTPVMKPAAAEPAVPSIPEVAPSTSAPATETNAIASLNRFTAEKKSSLRNAPVPAPHPAPKSVSSDDRHVWRQWILEGRTTDARLAMKKYLEANSDDSSTWALLADCERKQRNWYSAVNAYEKVITHGKAKEASHAKYMSASIYQERLDNHERAVTLFKEYRRSGYVHGELKDLTDVKIARSLVALGRCDEAVRILRQVIESQGDSFVAGNAKKLLKKCTGER